MARLAQDFSMRYMLVDGQETSVRLMESAGGQRYTEARLNKLAMEILVDIEKETVDWSDNFDNARCKTWSCRRRSCPICSSTALRGSP